MREFPRIIKREHVQNKLQTFKRSNDPLDLFLFKICEAEAASITLTQFWKLIFMIF